MFLDADELADLRSDMSSTFDSAAQVLKNSAAPNGRGQQTETWSPSGDPVPCTIWNGNRETDLAEAVVGGRLSSVVVWHVLMPVGTPVTTSDRLRVGDKVLEINGLNAGRTDGLALLAICREVS